ncbi:MAG: hypothetical protein ACRCXZ_04510 [Patescibacteria group bacterium]
MKLIAILGPTSSGKSQMAIDLVRYLQERNEKSAIISCDSRQVYKELDLLSGKEEGLVVHDSEIDMDRFICQDVDHYLISIVTLDKIYSLSEFIRDYVALISKIKSKYDNIILTGGSGMYSRAILEEYDVSNSHSLLNQKDALNQLSLTELQLQLDKSTFNNSDWSNKTRLINSIIRKDRVVEEVDYPKYTSKQVFFLSNKSEELFEKVKLRIHTRVQKGMLVELFLLVQKYGTNRIDCLGLESRIGVFYYLGMLTNEEFERFLFQKTKQYIKRQITWFSKEKNKIDIKTFSDLKCLV